jgi:acetylornithine deacetylase
MTAAPLDADLTRRLFAAIDADWDRQIAFTRELIRYPSLRGQEHTAQEFVHKALAERGYAMDRWTIDVDAIRDHPGFSPVAVPYDNAVNVIGTHTPRRATGRSLILNGHIDVVPEGPHDMWSRPPFEPHLEGDWLYGRGGADMKAGLVANVFAMDALRACGLQPAATVYIQSVTEEECTGNGALSALLRGYRADAAIIPEPEDDMVVRANCGVLWFAVEIRGKPVHVREAGSGSSAILSAWTVIGALQELERRWNAEKGEHRYFEDLGHPININIGKIAGGDWASSVPAWCRLDVRAAIYPGVEPRDAAAEIEAAIRQAAPGDAFLSNNPPRITFNGFFAKGYVLEEGTEAEATLARSFERASEGRTLQSLTTPGYLDGRVFVLYDDCPCLVFGPRSENIHGFDERVSLDSLKRVTKTIAAFIAEWCGTEPVDG